MNLFHHLAAYDLGAALRITDVHVKKELHDGVKTAAGEAPLPRLNLV